MSGGTLSRAVHGGRHAARQRGRVLWRGLQPRPSEAERRVFRCRAPSRCIQAELETLAS